MIEISNESLAKVLNLWTGTDEWHVPGDEDVVSLGNLLWKDYGQRSSDGTLFDPLTKDVKAHALVIFMLKERKYPKGGEIYYQETPEQYLHCVRHWEKRFGGMSYEELCIQPSEKMVDYCEGTEQIIDHSIPVRYDHIISTEELVKRAQEKWPEDEWRYDSEHHELIAMSQWFSRDNQTLVAADGNEGQDYLTRRARLLTLIDEARSEKTTPEILDEQPQEIQGTKAERFYEFLTTRQDNSAGLWGIVAMELQAPVRGGDDLGWTRKDVGAVTSKDPYGIVGEV